MQFSSALRAALIALAVASSRDAPTIQLNPDAGSSSPRLFFIAQDLCSGSSIDTTGAMLGCEERRLQLQQIRC
jgi:hypothetical protein